MLLVKLLFLLPSSALCASSVVDSTPTYEHQDPSTGKTLLCDKCPPGTHMAAHCTPSTSTKCVPCGENHFTELWNYLPRCLYCGNFCYENQEVETECSATSNRVCRCKEGFYSSSDFCFRHSECKPGLGVKTKGTSKTDTVCEHCADGYFSNSSSAEDPCVKHRECAPGQNVLLCGSVYHDAVCGTCEDLASQGEIYRVIVSRLFKTQRMRLGKMRKFVARYVSKPGRPISRHRGTLLEQITLWLSEAPVEQLKKLPEVLRATQLNSLADKLEKTVSALNCNSI
eukprot:XP_011603787.1 PREDICTED: tumor necrosis factor receptor superfamily member 11B-like [Takifugu rubripes]